MSPRQRLIDKVRIGTSGWSYPDWVGPFYPDGTARGGFLAEYTASFPVVEVDSTFYAVPSARTVEGWARNTPDGFRFALKVPGAVTHGASGERYRADRVLVDEEGVLDSYFQALSVLGEKAAIVLFQFPYFRVREMRVDDFLARLERVLDRVPSGWRYAVEIRNKGWLGEPLLSLLREHRVAAVLIDHPWMPPPRAQLERGMVTTDFSYIRLLGDRYAIEKKTTSWGAIVEDRSERIGEWAEVILEIARSAGLSAVWTFINNHFAGHGPASCRELGSRLSAPATGGDADAASDHPGS